MYPTAVPVVTHTASAKCRKELGAGPVTRNGKEKWHKFGGESVLNQASLNPLAK